jgi:hypothetical protein
MSSRGLDPLSREIVREAIQFVRDAAQNLLDVLLDGYICQSSRMVGATHTDETPPSEERHPASVNLSRQAVRVPAPPGRLPPISAFRRLAGCVSNAVCIALIRSLFTNLIGAFHSARMVPQIITPQWIELGANGSSQVPTSYRYRVHRRTGIDRFPAAPLIGVLPLRPRHAGISTVLRPAISASTGWPRR